MTDTIILMLTALCSGLIATVVTIYWQQKNQAKNEKRRIFSVLMSKRYDIASEDSVEALNMIDVIFYSSEKVRTAWKEFKDATNAPDIPTRSQAIQDKHLRLLEVVAEDIGYKQIKWEDIKHYYYPQGLSNKKQDEIVLRRVQIDSLLSQINSAKAQPQVGQVDVDSELKNEMLRKALENPDNLVKLMDVVEKAQGFVEKNRNFFKTDNT